MTRLLITLFKERHAVDEEEVRQELSCRYYWTHLELSWLSHQQSYLIDVTDQLPTPSSSES